MDATCREAMSVAKTDSVCHPLEVKDQIDHQCGAIAFVVDRQLHTVQHIRELHAAAAAALDARESVT